MTVSSTPAAPVTAGAAVSPVSTSRVRAAVDAERWPDVAAAPRCSAARAAVAAFLVRRALERLPLRVRLAGADGDDAGEGARTLGLGGPLMRVHDPRSFFRRIGAEGLIGFGESYMAGEWDADDLTGVLTVFADNVATLVPPSLQRLRGAWARRRPEAQRNTREGARDNIHRHYDLSNDLFSLFLDETMTYSSAVFRGFPADEHLLPAAQHRKIDLLLDAAGVGPGTRLLEIGTGWGELAVRAASRGARVVSVTLSREQRGLALERVRAAGLQDRVEVLLRDYREVEGEYDAVVSVEMIEAVGHEFWPEYFRTLERRLAPGGRIALQAITMPHDRMLVSLPTFTWIHKYVFPGGMIPSAEAISEVSGEATGLRIVSAEAFGPHYAETLRLWRERFARCADEVAALGFDAVFRRLWTFYLAYSEAGFRSGYLDVRQFVLEGAAGAAGASGPTGAVHAEDSAAGR
ncbi:class I SAM-dependent methyltransferase [Streptomyces sp. NPDC008317]|uniref:class I SAM-dependent methyltransferase n=1 Tax=Streptomyces sp. NPDC008317 TaxID=3364827 RepID=UPI0036E44167